ncbi:TetR/AcrR family transcriptional regulator [Sabulicella glaciei]|uniref:TetR/AcrR family transcriptional regulator n=1 Tax=Sabulicella glaciei TaxID=2984948 RepID=A0ABT3P1B7_9PROT|nr:TetR/AcrR family transcriptional regulator [Roseococcus sp. MDT2-1-1]MCW8087549.1 TetR/AcrR family transcriptional regulator [Roseococcus sp. MDT2-1-1]
MSILPVTTLSNEPRVQMRDEIKRVAARLLTLRGYRGVSYGDVASELEITTTNIHYHFGPKARLVAAVLADYIERVGGRYRAIWTSPATTLAQKVNDTVAFNREAFVRLNPTGTEGNSWSLITRLSAEGEALDDVMRERIVAFRRDIQASAAVGIETAVRNGELRPETPSQEIGRLVASCFLYAVHITRDSGGFRGLSQHYAVQLDLIERSWGAAHPKAVRKLIDK